MKIKRIRIGCIVGIIIAFALCCTACSDASERKKETAYAAFLVQKISDTSGAIGSLKSQMTGFSEEKLSDQEWIDQTTAYVSQINSHLDQIIQYENIPESMNSLHQSVISVCETGKNLTAQFETAIANKNMGIMTQVISGLNNLTSKTDSVINEIKGMISGDQ